MPLPRRALRSCCVCVYPVRTGPVRALSTSSALHVRPAHLVPRYDPPASLPISVHLHDTSLTLYAPSYGSPRLVLPFVRLRDACPGPQSVDPSTRQRLFRTTDIPSTIRPASYSLSGAGDDPVLEVEWDQPLEARPDASRRSSYSLSYLMRHRDARSLRAWHSDDVATPITWDRELIERRNLWIPYDQLDQHTVQLAAVKQLLAYGLVFFHDVPHQETNDVDCELPKLAERLGEIRRTWYGDRVWDVKSMADAKNIAYTNLDLGLHMDLLHYDNPPRFQLLHYLRGHDSLRGGESYFVDAYHAAADLRKAEPIAWQTLADTPIPFEYRNGGHWRHAERPTIELGLDGANHAVNYSPPFQAPLLLDSAVGIHRLHASLSAFTKRVESPELRFSVQLRPGEVAAFDNRRVLHARTAFTWDEAAVAASGEPGRHLKGCYLEGDSVRDRLRVLLASGEA